MRRLFVDTGAWLAVAARDDAHHREAAAFYRSQSGRVRWLTSDFVLDEVATRLRATQGAAAAVRFVRALLSSPHCQVVRVDGDVFETALGLMLKLADHRLSFTDCTSFALLADLGLGEAFAFDSDFVRCGYTIVP